MATLRKITRGYVYYKSRLQQPISKKQQKQINKRMQFVLNNSVAYIEMISRKKFATRVK